MGRKVTQVSDGYQLWSSLTYIIGKKRDLNLQSNVSGVPKGHSELQRIRRLNHPCPQKTFTYISWWLRDLNIWACLRTYLIHRLEIIKTSSLICKHGCYWKDNIYRYIHIFWRSQQRDETLVIKTYAYMGIITWRRFTSLLYSYEEMLPQIKVFTNTLSINIMFDDNSCNISCLPLWIFLDKWWLLPSSHLGLMKMVCLYRMTLVQGRCELVWWSQNGTPLTG